MARINNQSFYNTTHEGGKANVDTPLNQLRRAVLSCFLWEDTFYESGNEIASRIASLIPIVDAIDVANLAIQARNDYKLRHVPLFLVRELARYDRRYVAETLYNVIQRPDEITEFMAIYWKDGRTPIANQVKKGLAFAFTKFDEYSLAKYNKDSDKIKLRDVLFMVHAKPLNEYQGEIWKRLVDGTLATPDTWEVALSRGANKKETFERLMLEGKLGALATLRNLRNMKQAGVSIDFVAEYLDKLGYERVLPFRFIAAANAVESVEWKQMLEKPMLASLANSAKLPGHTVLLVDVSGSMNDRISGRSDLSRMDAACALAMIARELCETVDVFTFSSQTVHIKDPGRGFALAHEIVRSQPNNSTYLFKAWKAVNATTQYDRLIIFTDEQAHDSMESEQIVQSPTYVINVAPYKNSVQDNGLLTHINGFSEKVFDYIQIVEG